MKTILFIISFVAIYATMFSQDVIIKRDGTEIIAKVKELTLDGYIRYSLKETPDVIRYIHSDDIASIIYESGYRENFKLNTSTKSTIIVKPIMKSYPEEVKNEVETTQHSTGYKYAEGLGWIAGAKLNMVIPYDESVSEIYGYYPGFSLKSVYFGRGFGIDAECTYLRNPNGDPIIEGNGISSANCDIKISVFSISGYWAPRNPTTKNTFFLGGGFGGGTIKERLEISGYGETASGESKLDVSEGHISCGMLINHFIWEVKSSALLSEDSDINFGGFYFSAGVFF